MHKYKVLIADDEKIILNIIAEYVKEWGYEPVIAQNGQECLSIISKEPINVLILDLLMPVASGFDVLEYMHHHYPNIPVIIITGEVDINNAIQATKMGAYHYITKPIDFAKMEVVVQNAISLHLLEKKIKNLQKRIKSHHKKSIIKLFLIFIFIIMTTVIISCFFSHF